MRRYLIQSCFALLLTATTHAATGSDCRILDPVISGQYEGGCKDGLADGHGKAVGQRTYQGSFVAGKRQGAGLEIFPSGSRFVGEFAADRPHGTGRLYFSNGDMLEGDFRNGRLAGTGTVTKPSGEKVLVVQKDKKFVRVAEPSPPASPSAAIAPTPAPAATTLDWTPALTLGGEIFPSFILANATRKLVNNPPRSVVGDPFGTIGIRLRTTQPNTKVSLRIEIDQIAEPTSVEESLSKPGEYLLLPKIRYRYDALTRLSQPITVNVTWTVGENGAPAASKTDAIRVRSVNDVPYAFKKQNGTDAHIDWMFAAFVNEDHPGIDVLLRDALKTHKVRAFVGYQGTPQDVLKQVDAIWTALQRRGIRYSSITTTSGESEKVYSQHVRFLSESVRNTQANCIDGTVLLASILRKIDIDPVIVLVPGHAFLGFYTQRNKQGLAFLETTMIGNSKLGPALVTGSRTYAKYAASLGIDPRVQVIDIERARQTGIVPIPR